MFSLCLHPKRPCKHTKKTAKHSILYLGRRLSRKRLKNKFVRIQKTQFSDPQNCPVPVKLDWPCRYPPATPPSALRPVLATLKRPTRPSKQPQSPRLVIDPQNPSKTVTDDLTPRHSSISTGFWNPAANAGDFAPRLAPSCDCPKTRKSHWWNPQVKCCFLKYQYISSMFPFDVPIWCWEFPFFGVQDGSSWSWCWWVESFTFTKLGIWPKKTWLKKKTSIAVVSTQQSLARLRIPCPTNRTSL